MTTQNDIAAQFPHIIRVATEIWYDNGMLQNGITVAMRTDELLTWMSKMDVAYLSNMQDKLAALEEYDLMELCCGVGLPDTDPTLDKFLNDIFNGDFGEFDKRLLESGKIHRSREAAKMHLAAIIAINTQGD